MKKMFSNRTPPLDFAFQMMFPTEDVGMNPNLVVATNEPNLNSNQSAEKVDVDIFQQ
jgi:hypothetical protein